MELSYWESRWNKNKTGFHMAGGYPGLKTHWNHLGLPDEPSVLVPLCGKTEDMSWMAEKGAQVTGVEISEKAVREFFEEQKIEFETTRYAGFTIFHAERIELWQGDFMKFPAGKKREFDLIYDKAALVALPPAMRKAYAARLLELAGNKTTLLLHHFVYPQHQMPGPPFSVEPKEITTLFPDAIEISLLEENSIPAEQFPPFKLRGLVSPLTERLLCLK